MAPSVCLSQPRQNWCVQSKDMAAVWADARSNELEGVVSRGGCLRTAVKVRWYEVLEGIILGVACVVCVMWLICLGGVVCCWASCYLVWWRESGQAASWFQGGEGLAIRRQRLVDS